jgi:hypothetical protein
MIGRGIPATTTTGMHEDGSGIQFPNALFLRNLVIYCNIGKRTVTISV